MKQKNFYLTTPIFYPNDKLHVGHAYTMSMADIIVRYKKSQGYTVYFQTGSDDHGEKIAKKAASLGITPQQLVDKNVLLFQQLWQKLGISSHTFYRTSSAQHKEKVQKIFTKLLAQDDIYLGKYHGSYCVPCEDYIRESKVVNNCCPFCNSPLRTIEEPAYFLRVSKYYANLTTYYEKNPYFLLPSRAKKDLFANFLQNDIRDLCITRSDIEWGIPVPNHKKMVIYVWFEALLNYLNSEAGAFFFTAEFPRETKNSPAPDVATEYLLKKSTAKEIIHLLGKEITRFHAIYWPIILFSLSKRLPDKILAHGWLITPQGKMSKSKGNVIDPLELLKKYPSDLLKSYLVAKVNFLQDGVFSEELLKGFHQDFFVHNLGNLCSRVGKMVELYNNGLVPDFAESENPYLKKYYQTCLRTIGEYQKLMDNYQLTAAFQEIQTLLDLSNKLIQEIEPWNLFKESQVHEKKLELNTTLNYLINGIKIVAYLLNPVAPESSQMVLEHLNLVPKDCSWENIQDFNQIRNQPIKSLAKPLFLPL